jgi:hypothetical protein
MAAFFVRSVWWLRLFTVSENARKGKWVINYQFTSEIISHILF